MGDGAGDVALQMKKGTQPRDDLAHLRPRRITSTYDTARYLGIYENDCPPTVASAIAPAFGCTKIATPSVYFALAAAPLLRITAEALAANFNCPCLKRSKAALFSNAMTSVNSCPPICAPTVACEMSA